MNRAYISTADFRAPYDAATLQGLGRYGDEILHFPKAGRSYYSTANYRAPYDDGFFQDNDLFGVPAQVDELNKPPSIQRYINGGAAPNNLGRDLMTPFNQIPRWAYLVAGAAAIYVFYKRYEKSQKKKG